MEIRNLVVYIATSLDGFISKPNDDLVDQLFISIIPILLGDGIRLFKDGRPEQKLKLASSKSYESGLAQLHYMRTTR